MATEKPDWTPKEVIIQLREWIRLCHQTAKHNYFCGCGYCRKEAELREILGKFSGEKNDG